MIRPPARSVCLGFLVATQILASTLLGQTEGPIAKSSDLSTALPPGRWRELNASVDRGLAWLAANQQEDGSFPAEDRFQPAVTAFATMAFLSRGHTPQHKQYGPIIQRAIDYTLNTQTPRGFFSAAPVRIGASGDPSPHQTAHYNHAIAGLMLGEVYGMTQRARSQRIKAALQRALGYTRSFQSDSKEHASEQGGFRYYKSTGPNGESDISVTGWQLMFLRSARNAEFNVPKLYFDQGLNFVERCQVPADADQTNGTFGYRPPDTGQCRPTLPNTGSALLALLMGGRQDRPSVKRAIKWYALRPYPKPWQNERHYYLATYYSSQAMAQAGGRVWETVFPQIAKSLMDEQLESGSWPEGSAAELSMGPGYTTSLAILALTPPLQMLPIYQR